MRSVLMCGAIFAMGSFVMGQATAPSVDAAAGPLPIKVSPDGSGKFSSIKAALESLPKKSDLRQTIQIAPGEYRERLQIPKDLRNITLIGMDDPAKVRIVFSLHAGENDPVTSKPVGTSGSETVLVQGDGFTAENITFENDAGEKGPAVAMRTMGDRAIFRKCRFIGWQDTLYTNGVRHYFVDCYIEGRVDFIFGRATSVFERCEIVSKNSGFVTAASTKAETKFGLVFMNCKLRSNDSAKSFLGRPWRPDSAVTYINCEMGDHIRPEGWDNWGKAENEKTARYSEYGSTGPGGDMSKRVGWAKKLSKEEAEAITVKSVLSGSDGWDPTAP